MAEIDILLLGPPEVRRGEEPVSIRRRIPRVLLFYLASQGSMVGRDSLLTLFWEDEPDDFDVNELEVSYDPEKNKFNNL